MPLVLTQNQLNPAKPLPLYFLKIQFSVIVPSKSRSSKWSLSSYVPIQLSLYFFLSQYAVYVPPISTC